MCVNGGAGFAFARRLRRAEHQYWDRRMANERIRNAAEPCTAQPGTSVRCHDN
jgi:hypothetical protein